MARYEQTWTPPPSSTRSSAPTPQNARAPGASARGGRSGCSISSGLWCESDDFRSLDRGKSGNYRRMEWECAVVGAGAAGLSAALVLGRARRKAIVIDADDPSN